jgi:hypothetical protein
MTITDQAVAASDDGWRDERQERESTFNRQRLAFERFFAALNVVGLLALGWMIATWLLVGEPP